MFNSNTDTFRFLSFTMSLFSNFRHSRPKLRYPPLYCAVNKITWNWSVTVWNSQNNKDSSHTAKYLMKYIKRKGRSSLQFCLLKLIRLTKTSFFLTEFSFFLFTRGPPVVILSHLPQGVTHRLTIYSVSSMFCDMCI